MRGVSPARSAASRHARHSRHDQCAREHAGATIASPHRPKFLVLLIGASHRPPVHEPGAPAAHRRARHDRVPRPLPQARSSPLPRPRGTQSRPVYARGGSVTPQATCVVWRADDPAGLATQLQDVAVRFVVSRAVGPARRHDLNPLSEHRHRADRDRDVLGSLHRNTLLQIPSRSSAMKTMPNVPPSSGSCRGSRSAPRLAPRAGAASRVSHRRGGMLAGRERSLPDPQPHGRCVDLEKAHGSTGSRGDRRRGAFMTGTAAAVTPNAINISVSTGSLHHNQKSLTAKPVGRERRWTGGWRDRSSSGSSASGAGSREPALRRRNEAVS